MYSFKRLYFSYLFAILPLFLIPAILFLFNVLPFRVEGTVYNGFVGFLCVILYAFFMSLIIAGMNWVFLKLGNFIYPAFFKKNENAVTRFYSLPPYSFEKLFFTYCSGIIPFMILWGILIFGAFIPIYFNEKPVYGLLGVVMMILSIPVFGLMLTVINFLTLGFGNNIYKMINKKQDC